ncbi:hypothetical protein EVG20_g312 [Dentipellis fragilis]|uniref:F-box domain-containing protein n=1 Tax=Dentipellis fragilis TaxID=205917 RepID=A0A4Y9ZFQ6_9AGAM|nr:hypothetical protein EVG20_g312 [Dentipellis fragilis]
MLLVTEFGRSLLPEAMVYTPAELRESHKRSLPTLDSCDLAGQVVVITGANAEAIHVLLHDTKREEGAIEYRHVHLDLASFASVRAFAAKFLESGLPLNTFISNAAVAGVGKVLTEDGLDIQVQVNYISPTYLAMLLYPALRRIGSIEGGPPARVIGVTSEGAFFTDFPESADPRPVKAVLERVYYPPEQDFSYFNTKLLNIIGFIEIARRIPLSANVKVAVAGPGLVETELATKDASGKPLPKRSTRPTYGTKARAAEEGARTIILVTATYPVERVWATGDNNVPFFSSMKLLGELPVTAQDEDVGKRVWEDTIYCPRCGDTCFLELGSTKDKISGSTVHIMSYKTCYSVSNHAESGLMVVAVKRVKSEELDEQAESQGDNSLHSFDILNMPLDVLYEILCLLTSADLMHLARTRKDIRAVLMSRKSSFAWRAARINTPGPAVPEPPEGMCEPSWANLLFGDTHCSKCDKDYISKFCITFEFRRRLCDACLKKGTCKFEDVKKKFPKFEKGVLDLVPYVNAQAAGRVREGKPDQWYFIEDLRSANNRILEFKREQGRAVDFQSKLDAWMALERAKTVAVSENCAKIRAWVNEYDDWETAEEEAARKKKYSDMMNHFVGLGHHPLEASAIVSAILRSEYM